MTDHAAPNQNITSLSSSDPRDLRREYKLDSLVESAVASDPIVQFGRWFADAERVGIREPNMMTLATVGPSGAPSARIVLLKEFNQRGFAFHTNYASRKARELTANPQAALVLFWEPLERQVRIEGTIEKLSRGESEAYFKDRPRGSQIGAWVSHQSEVVTREQLEKRLAELTARFEGQPVPTPDFWGGFRLVPTSIEFWQGRPSRLHDRLQYLREGTRWTLRRLAP